MIGKVIIILGIFFNGNFPLAIKNLTYIAPYQRQMKEICRIIKKDGLKGTSKEMGIKAFKKPYPDMVMNPETVNGYFTNKEYRFYAHLLGKNSK